MKTSKVNQVAAFEKLVGYCNAHGAMYNPSKASLKVAALNTLLTSAQQSLEAVNTLRTAYNNAVVSRNLAFESLPKFMTRIVNTLASTDANDATVQQAYAFIKRFRPSGRDREAIASGNPGMASEPTITRSTAQLDFDSKLDNFAALVKLVSAEPFYKPNETELQGTSLNVVVASLREKNKAVITAHVSLSNARAARNRLLYGKTGIHGIATDVKRYIKGLFGFESTGYEQIASLKFVNAKNR